MIQTGKLFEDIVELLTRFRSEVQAYASLGLLNNNKHAENFMKRILNLTYGYELDNLNKNSSNFPGIDLGDAGEGVAYQITSARKSDKIDDTLETCLKYKHYETFKTINVFILTTKQSSYTLKVATEPHFSFSAVNNIRDFDDLFKNIQHLGPVQMQALHAYIKGELAGLIDSIHGEEAQKVAFLLDTASATTQSRLPHSYVFQAKITLLSEKVSVPNLYAGLSAFLTHPDLKNKYLAIFNEAFRKASSQQRILYMQPLQPTGAGNFFHGYALALEPSTIVFEKADYGDGSFLTNLDLELIPLLACLLFFGKSAKGNFELGISVRLTSDEKVYLAAQNSILIGGLTSNYILMSPYEFTETISNIHTSTIIDLLRNILHGFMSHETGFSAQGPFISIDRPRAEYSINEIKKGVGISYNTVPKVD